MTVAWKHCIVVFDRHSDWISNLSILAIDTCIVASKIFSSIPAFFPRASLVLLNYVGIIWINLQLKDLAKCCRDIVYAFQIREMFGVLIAVIKVIVKASNILFSSVTFIASIVALVGCPSIAHVMYYAMKPFALTTLGIGIGLDIGDYAKNEQLLRQFQELKKETKSSERIQDIVKSFKTTLLGEPSQQLAHRDRAFVVEFLRQLDEPMVRVYKECFSKNHRYWMTLWKHFFQRRDAVQLFSTIEESIKTKQTMTRANLGLTALGYGSMTIHRAFPDTLLQASVTWGMCVLYTSKMVYEKTQNYLLQIKLS